MMICGGTEAAVTPMGIGGFAAMRALSTRNDEPERASRPWDRDRDGFVVGEGAGILILEELEFARSRGARILAEMVGYGMSADAFHVTAPPEDGDGAYRVMRNALRDAKIGPEQVQYINAHGTSTDVGDRAETEAHQACLRRPCLQAGCQLHQVDDRPLAGRRRWIRGRNHSPGPSRPDRAAHHQLREPRPGCDLDYVPNRARPMKIDYALSNSFGFGGTNGCLIFKRYQE
jgi:3-oxoacyl-[acyl-carrier-protein] synthase II